MVWRGRKKRQLDCWSRRRQPNLETCRECKHSTQNFRIIRHRIHNSILKVKFHIENSAVLQKTCLGFQHRRGLRFHHQLSEQGQREQGANQVILWAPSFSDQTMKSFRGKSAKSSKRTYDVHGQSPDKPRWNRRMKFSDLLMM